MVGGFGFAAFIFSFLALAIVNPENESPDLEEPGGNIYSDPKFGNRVPGMYRIFAAIYTGMAIVGLLLIRESPKSLMQGNQIAMLDSEAEVDPMLTKVDESNAKTKVTMD